MKDQIEKQAIEEMAQDLNMLDTLQCDFRYSVNYQRAKGLYSLGYRKQSDGKWKQTTEPLGAHDVDCVECSVCGESWVLDEDFDYDVVKDFWNFCPNCGARMSGGKNE